MFKVTITQVDNNVEEEIIIKCHEVNDEVINLVQQLKTKAPVIIGMKENEFFRLSIKDIFYIESVDNKTFIYVKDGVYDCKLKLYEIEELFATGKLFRCSKSMILNISKIKSVSPSINGRFNANLINGETVIISRQYVPILKKLLGLWGFFMKKIFKLYINIFLAVTVSLLFILSLIYTLSGIDFYSIFYPWQILFTGAISSLPIFVVTLFDKEPTKKQFYLRQALHFVLTLTIVLVVGFIFKWYHTFIDFMSVSITVIIIYVIVYLYVYFTTKTETKNINKALQKFNEEEHNIEDNEEVFFNEKDNWSK